MSRNRTLVLTSEERSEFKRRLLRHHALPSGASRPLLSPYGRIIVGDSFDVLSCLPRESVDLIILDPPYNLSKTFGSVVFRKRSIDQYTLYLHTLFKLLRCLLKPTGTIYICGDWRSSISIYMAAREFFLVQNRITWEREKGRGAQRNWKNASEDIWFCTASNDFTFNVNDVKLRRGVRAPYRNKDGSPKDWNEAQRTRDTFPSNLWTDITVPFWSMPENTNHPTQKPEKLIARLILASSNPGDVVLDPFLGSGTTVTVAKKLGRLSCGIELDEEYAAIAAKRLSAAIPPPLGGSERTRTGIQGYSGGVFWERNTQRGGHEK